MTTSQIPTDTASRAEAGSASRSLQQHIRQLLLDCPSRQAFYQQVLEVAMGHFSAAVGRVDYSVGGAGQAELRHGPQMTTEVAARFSAEYLAPFAQEIRSGGRTEAEMKRYQRGEQTMTLISSPVMNIGEDKCDAVLSLMLSGPQSADVLLPRLDGIATLASAVLVSKTLTARNQTQPAGTQAAGSAAAASAAAGTAQTQPSAASPSADAAALQNMSAFARASQFASTKEFGYSLVNSLLGQLQAEQVSFGVHKEQRVVVEAISGVADFKANSPGVQIVRQCMEECVDHTSPVVVQSEKLEGDFPPLPIHTQWSAESAHASVISIPLKDGDNISGVISIRRAAERPFRAEEVAGLTQMLTPYGNAIPVVEKANRSVGDQLKNAVGTTARNTVKSGSAGRKILLASLAIGLLWFLFGSTTYRPICRTRVTAAQLRHFAAPIDGQLKAVFVSPGQQVKQGELLVQFDTSDIELRLNGLVREIASAELELREAMAADDVASAALARSRSNVLKTQAQALRKQVDDSSIVAPFDGTVVVADLQQRIGQLFPRGDEILQIAAAGDWLLEIEIPDDIATYVAADQVGEFSAAAAPADKHAFTVQHVDGSAITMEDRNVFIARAPLESRPAWMMTGMEGTARIETVSRPVWWVAMHRVVDWGRMNFWF
ncbi:MAG: HlyD family efflux transporter periplasmic adaptor subunit [Planctomycetaceae bacterium]|nr:HlyD family efflux transporter periplasmic adaptor subunit [Planctomycetaceae bacterium]